MKVIYLIRHGQAVDDVEELFGGSADHAPTEKGLKDAEAFAEKFKGKNIDIVITSPYQRARLPAEIVAKKLNVPIKYEKDLRERNQYGILTGMKKDEATKKYPKLVEALKKPASEIKGAEPNEQFRKRAREAVQKIWKRREKRALVFTHLGIILATLNLHYGDLEIEHYGWLRMERENDKRNILESEKAKFK